jgi:signal transduction histidine kinase/CheY-like chemotaxis protein
MSDRFQAARGPHSGRPLERRVRGPATLLVGSALAGVFLTAASGAALLSGMRPPLEEELAKRSVAACRAAASELQVDANVSDGPEVRRHLAGLEREPSARLDGALVEMGGEKLAEWRRDPATAFPPEVGAPQPSGAITRAFVELAGRREALVSCPVEAIRPGGPDPAADGRLWMLVDTAEISGTVRRGSLGALGLVCVAIFFAVGLQLAIALRVVRRLDDNVRQLRDTQGRLIQSDKLAAVGTLSAGVAHEINNPLAYVIANMDHVHRELAGPELPSDPEDLADLRAALAEARQGAERVRVIVRDLKAMARGDEETVAPLDVAVVAESSLNIAMNEIKHRARLVRELSEVARVDANEVRLGQVILNLLVNAAHAIPEGARDRNEIRLVTRMWPDGRVAVEVRDTGSGIPKENMDKLFDPFFTTKAVGVGTGLGLWICHNIVGSMGGEIAIESEVGRGTVVRVLLPPSQQADEDFEAPEEPGAEPGGSILVVDDEVMVGRSIERLLGTSHQVVSTTRAAEALRWLSQGKRFDVILCDVMMPEMTGIEFYNELGRSHREMRDRVVFITGGAFTPGAAEFIRLSRNVRVDKPFDEGKLRAAISDILRRDGDRVARDAPESKLVAGS